MNKLSATSIERRELACGTCKGSYEVCPECGLRLAFSANQSKIVCKDCNVEMVITHHIRQDGLEMMGLPAFCDHPVWSCPLCNKQWSNYTHEQPETIYVKEWGTKEN